LDIVDPIKAMARHPGISKDTVKRVLAADAPPEYRRPRKGSIVDDAARHSIVVREQPEAMPRYRRACRSHGRTVSLLLKAGTFTGREPSAAVSVRPRADRPMTFQ
jgi:hypothetical protein